MADMEGGWRDECSWILNYEMEFDLNNPYESTNEEFLDMYSSEHQEIDVENVMVDVVQKELQDWVLLSVL